MHRFGISQSISKSGQAGGAKGGVQDAQQEVSPRKGVVSAIMLGMFFPTNPVFFLMFSSLAVFARAAFLAFRPDALNFRWNGVRVAHIC